MQHGIFQLARRAITFTSISLFWFMLSAALMHFSLNGLYAPETSLQTTVTWYGFLFQVSLFWLSLIAGGVGLAHVTFTRQWYHSLRNIMVLWQGVISQQWQLMSFILVLSYTALAFMVYVVQKNMGLDGQLLLAVTSAALVMFSREISQKALYIVARVAPDSRI
ncbi:hypothetical protein [Alkanindiges illinoisensis]|uniref:hypothetical protein n=1 Tax=Alkanindiges illinoisensis TaxID=197183 RepID=UPI00047C2D51|nr:hypothetical protein [Alkanindiges illinoisensis]